MAVQDLTGPLVEKLGLRSDRGALVAAVMTDSPAAQAGIKPGDVIVQWDKRPIDNSNDLRIAVSRTNPGTKAKVVFYRDGNKQEATLATAQRPSQSTQ